MEKAKLGGYRYTNFFYKKICKPMMKWVIIGYEKNNVSGGSRWKLVKR